MSHLTLIHSRQKRDYHYEQGAHDGIYHISRYEVKRVGGSHVCIRDIPFMVVSDRVENPLRVVLHKKPKKFYFRQVLRFQEGPDVHLPLDLSLLIEQCCTDDVEIKHDLRLGEISTNHDFMDNIASIVSDSLVSKGTLLYVPHKWYYGFNLHRDHILLKAKNLSGEKII